MRTVRQRRLIEVQLLSGADKVRQILAQDDFSSEHALEHGADDRTDAARRIDGVRPTPLQTRYAATSSRSARSQFSVGSPPSERWM